MHADTPDRDQLAKSLQVLAEVRIGLVDITVAGCQGFIVIPDFVAQGSDFADDPLVPTFRDCPEIIDAVHPLLCLHAGCPEGVPGQKVHVMSQDQRIEIVGFQGIQKIGVFFQRKVHHQKCNMQAP